MLFVSVKKNVSPITFKVYAPNTRFQWWQGCLVLHSLSVVINGPTYHKVIIVDYDAKCLIYNKLMTQVNFADN